MLQSRLLIPSEPQIAFLHQHLGLLSVERAIRPCHRILIRMSSAPNATKSVDLFRAGQGKAAFNMAIVQWRLRLTPGCGWSSHDIILDTYRPCEILNVYSIAELMAAIRAIILNRMVGTGIFVAPAVVLSITGSKASSQGSDTFSNFFFFGKAKTNYVSQFVGT